MKKIEKKGDKNQSPSDVNNTWLSSWLKQIRAERQGEFNAFVSAQASCCEPRDQES